MSISVIITTYQRPSLLRETVESCVAQTRLPGEILIGDDSADDATERLVKEQLIPQSPVPIRYFHHQPALKEVANVDFLYGQAQGKQILHLHDDDPIYPNCIDDLAKPFEQHPEIIASFGLQVLIHEDGTPLSEKDQDVNEGYLRVPERAGLVDSLLAGAVSMFPNNGFLVDAETARRVGYADGGRAGSATDFYFGFRLGQQGRPFYFVNTFTTKVRLTRQGQSRMAVADNAFRSVKILLEDLRPEQITPEMAESLAQRIRPAIAVACQNGNRDLARKWYFSPYHRRFILTPGGLKRFLGLWGADNDPEKSA